MGTKRHDDSDDDDDDGSMFSLDGDAREPLHRAERANRQRAAAETAARREARLVERARRRRHSATVRRGPACVQPNSCQPWIHPWDDPEPKTLRQLCVHALAGVLRETTSLPRSMPSDLINATMDKCRLDPRILAMCLVAGATKLHLRDFASIPDEPLTAAWRCWQAGTTVDVPRPPSERSTPIPACMVEPIDGILHPRRDGWTELFALADTLETVIIECGDSGEDDESHRYLSEVIAGLCGTRALSRMALGFFERVTDETLAPLWGGGCVENKGENNGEGDLPPLTSSSRANRGALVPSIPVHVPVRAPPALTRLDLSHLPNVTDATVRSTLCHVPTLTKLRLEFLPVTDACISDWRATLANLEWLEVTSCPYMRFAFPDVDWLHPPNKLRTLRIQPGGSRNIPKGADRDQRDMRVSARHLHQLSFAKRSAIVHLCLGCEFAAPEGENRRLGVGGNVGGYRSETVWDLRDAPLRGVTHLELYRTRQIIWPRRVAQWTDCLESLVIETVDDGLIHRLVGVKTLRRLVICDCGDMDVDEFVAIGKFICISVWAIRMMSCFLYIYFFTGKLKNLTELRCGGVTERLGPFAGDVTCGDRAWVGGGALSRVRGVPGRGVAVRLVFSLFSHSSGGSENEHRFKKRFFLGAAEQKAGKSLESGLTAHTSVRACSQSSRNTSMIWTRRRRSGRVMYPIAWPRSGTSRPSSDASCTPTRRWKSSDPPPSAPTSRRAT